MAKQRRVSSRKVEADQGKWMPVNSSTKVSSQATGCDTGEKK